MGVGVAAAVCPLVGGSVARSKLLVHTLQMQALHCWDSTTRRGCIASFIGA